MAVTTKPSVTVKLRAEAYTVLEKLVAQVARFGWTAIGRNSDETPTKEAMVAYAITELAAKKGKK